MTDKISNKVNTALDSFDGILQAEPKPFLLTRIHAALSRETPQSIWQQAAGFIKKPAVAACSIVLLLALNIALFSARNSAAKNDSVAGRIASSKYDFSINVAGIYDTENPGE
jgi:anti-sigma-K factor RskA